MKPNNRILEHPQMFRQLTPRGATLWEMVYFKARARK
jgi:hypothetical protein